MKEIKTEAAALEAVRQNGRTLCYVPGALKSTEAAVRESGWTLCHVPMELRSEEVRQAAVRDMEREAAGAGGGGG
jgi:hypothetical protein